MKTNRGKENIKKRVMIKYSEMSGLRETKERDEKGRKLFKRNTLKEIKTGYTEMKTMNKGWKRSIL